MICTREIRRILGTITVMRFSGCIDTRFDLVGIGLLRSEEGLFEMETARAPCECCNPPLDLENF